MKTVIGIIGVGRWGTNYVRTLKELGANIKWVNSRTKKSIDTCIRKTGIKNTLKTTDYYEILKDKEVNAVAIITHGSAHYKLTKDALTAGKHVIVDKPLAFTTKQAKELVSLAKKKKKILMVGHLHRFNPYIQKIKTDMDKGKFGKINYIQSLGAGNGPIRTDMSALWDFFPHDATIFLYLLGKVPLSVSANGASYTNNKIEDMVEMHLTFSGGITATAVGSWLYPVKKRDLIIVGDKMMAVYDDYASKEKLKYFNRRNNLDYTVQKVKSGKPLTIQLEHFLSCILNNKEPLTGGNQAINVTKVLETAYNSMKKNGARMRVQK